VLHCWVRMKRYSLAGWKHSSTRLFLVLFLTIIAVSAWSSPPFWITFTSLIPFLLLYIPLIGLVLELLERDWEDWHLW
jgi:hypothetical protein